MSNDKFQDKYNEIFQEVKEEKMDWDFEDFLKKTENQQNAKLIPIQKNKVLPKFFWIAASVILILGLFFVFKNFNNKIQQKDELVRNEIERQKKSGELIDTLSINKQTVALNDTLKNDITKDSLEADSTTVENISVEKLLPKKERLRRASRQYLVQNDTAKSKNPEYQANYVIINGHKIESEKEAIDVAKYSFQMLSDKVAETVATTNQNLNVDY